VPPVVQFAFGYGAGLWVGLVVSVPVGVRLVPLVLAAALALHPGRRWAATLVAVFGVGLWQGSLARGARQDTCAARWRVGRHTAVVVMSGVPDARGSVPGVVRASPDGCGGAVTLTLPDTVPPGATVIAVGSAAGGRLAVRHVRVLHRPRALRARLRAALATRLTTLYGRRAPLVIALVLGERHGIARDLRDTFADAGLAHLLAISGLHVGVVALWLALLLQPLGRRAATVVGTLAVWAYVALLGFPAAATRAAAFIAFLAVARLRQRHPPFTAMLASAVLLLLAVDPATVTAVGAWLSITAVWGTYRGVRLVGRRWRGVGVSVGATLATAPITAYVFGAVAPIGIAVNLVAIPLMALAVPGIFASLVWSAFAGGAGLVLAAIERLAALAAAVPWGHVRTVPGVSGAWPWALLLAGTWWVLRNRPTVAVVRRRVMVLGATMAWGVAAVALRPHRERFGLSIYVLDVGQGDAILVRTPHGHWVAMDGGPVNPLEDAARRVELPFLRRHGARALDVVIDSHGDADHLGGIPELIAAFPPRLLLEPGQPLGTPLYERYQATVAAYGIPWRAARLGDTVMLDGVRFAVLHPTDVSLAHELRPNENSVIVRVSYGAFDAVLTGDAGFPAESVAVSQVGRSEVLKVGHHGSAGATGNAWLDAVAPKAAVISVGAHNRYGHPAPATLRRLARRGISMWRTDDGGTVTIWSDGRYFQVSQGTLLSPVARLRCLVRSWSRSKASSSKKNACTPKPAASSPTSFTTWPSPPS